MQIIGATYINFPVGISEFIISDLLMFKNNCYLLTHPKHGDYNILTHKSRTATIISHIIKTISVVILTFLRLILTNIQIYPVQENVDVKV